MSKRLEATMGFGHALSIQWLLLLSLILWLAACDTQFNSTKSESEEHSSPNTALIEDGFYGQNTTLSSESTAPSKTNPIQKNQVYGESPLSRPGSNNEETAGDNETDKHNQTEAQDKIAGGREIYNDSEELIANLGFSKAQEEAPMEAAEKARSFACAEKLDSPAKPEHSSKSVCKRISDRLASVSMQSCQSANLVPSQCESVKQFPILFTEFPPLPERKPLGRILVIGGTHGDELTSVSIVFRWIAKLNKFHSGLFHWRLAPMLNPDGVLKREATRTNQNGVDLNRNMPSNDWEENAIKYWTEKSGENKRRYPGPEAASEPETRWLIDQINTFKPDAIISVHAPYGVVDYDALKLNTAPKSLGKLALNLLGTYPGSLGNYAGINLDIPVITLELPHAWVMPSEQESTKIWEDIVSWLRKNVNNPELAGN